ncbi:unnamed protein product [Closterium sp. NIES-64]|nr:unnamed protein product [Closterium sp. NIES-64]
MSGGPPARAAPGAPTRAAPQPQRPEAGGSGERESAESPRMSSGRWSGGGRSAIGLGRESALRLSTVREESGATTDSPSQASQRAESAGADAPLSPHTPHRAPSHHGARSTACYRTHPTRQVGLLVTTPPMLCAEERWSATVAYDACVRMCMDEASKGSPHAHFFPARRCLRLSAHILRPLVPTPVTGRGEEEGQEGEQEQEEGETEMRARPPCMGSPALPSRRTATSSARKKNRSIGTLKLQGAAPTLGDVREGDGRDESSFHSLCVGSPSCKIKGGMANLRGLAAEATTAAPGEGGQEGQGLQGGQGDSGGSAQHDKADQVDRPVPQGQG